jgi:hypothetical protein
VEYCSARYRASGEQDTVAVSCGLEFVVGDCDGQSLDGCGVLY